MHIHMVRTRQRVYVMALKFFGSLLAVQIEHGDRFQIFSDPKCNEAECTDS